MTFCLSTEPVLDSESGFRVVPAQRLLETRYDAGAALDASVGVCLDISFLVQRVDFGGANIEAVLRLTFFSADLLVDLDVAFLVDLEDVSPEFVFHLHSSISPF
jgi:hypothetical protein